jgi:hypothetical protein
MGNNVDGGNVDWAAAQANPANAHIDFSNMSAGYQGMQDAWNSRVQGMKDRAFVNNLQRSNPNMFPRNTTPTYVRDDNGRVTQVNNQEALRAKLPQPSYSQQRTEHRRRRAALNRQIAEAGARRDWDTKRRLESELSQFGYTNDVFPLFQYTQNIAGVGPVTGYSGYGPSSRGPSSYYRNPPSMRTGYQVTGSQIPFNLQSALSNLLRGWNSGK